MAIVQGIIRPLAQDDLRRHGDLRPLVEAWSRHDAQTLCDLENGPFAAHADDLVLVEAVPDGQFLYLHYGEGVGGGSGLSMQGQTTGQFDSPIGRVFAQTYAQALASNVPMYAVNRAKQSHLTHSWQRLLLPMPGGVHGGVPGVPSRVLALVRPLNMVEGILSDFARDAGFFGGTLEPVIEDEVLRDFALLTLSQPADLFGLTRMETLGDLMGRALSAAELEGINTAHDGQSAVHLEVPTSMERFGRIFMLKITGGARQPVFSISDATGLVEARSAAQESRLAMEDFAHTASDWMWESDADHKLTMVTQAIEAVLGYPPSHFIGKSRVSIGEGQENSAAFQAHARDLAAMRPFSNLVYRAVAQDGTARWLRVNGVPRFGPQGMFLGYRGTGTNITVEVEAQRALEVRKAAMEDFADIASDWLWEIDADHIITMMSPAIEQVTGRKHTDYLGTSRYDLIGSSMNDDVMPAHRADLEAHRPFRGFVYRLPLANGQLGWAKTSGKPLFDGQGRFLGYRGTGTNITQEVEARYRAERRTRELAEAHKLGRLGVWWYDRELRSIQVSPEVYPLLGMSRDTLSLSSRAVLAMLMPGEGAKFLATLRAVLAGKESCELDLRVRRRDGSTMDCGLIARAKRGPGGALLGLQGSVQDITERKNAERDLARLAYHDPLTALGNRSYFSREMQEILVRLKRSKESAGLLLLDLDHFKEVNDSLGHAAGDELLRRVAERLVMTVAGFGVVCRLGGDEFADIVTRVKSAAELASIAAGILSAFAGTVKLFDGAHHVTTSIGMVLLPGQTQDPDEAMRFADLALYEAKAEGRNRALLFHAALDRVVQDRVSLGRDLRDALKNDGLEAHYQLQVDVMAGRVTGFEALARWNHPIRGYVPPSQFIPVAESSRLIADLGAWMVRQTCQQGRAWLDAGGAPLELSVNLSVAQLWHRDVESDIRSALDETGLPPGLLCLELTESVFADDAVPRIRRLFSGLKSAGVKIALDDFGTGYSSLKYLSDLSFDKLKIDRSFVSNCHQSEEQRRLLQGIVGLGRGLGLQVIVEGVESEQELQVVCDLGCDVVQGYYFGRPKSFDQACLDAAQVEVDYGFAPVLWKTRQQPSASAFLERLKRLGKAG